MAVQKVAPPSPKRKRTTPFHEFSSYENGRVRNLRFNVNALADFEQETGMGFAQLMKQRAVFASARAMLWAGLKHEDRSLTIDQVGDLLGEYLGDEKSDTHGIDEILTVALKAAVDQGALGRQVTAASTEEQEEEEPKKLASGPNEVGVIDLDPSSDETKQTPMTPEMDD